jgi:ABC-type Fe3+-hydroxamate transport system substrate-binding protein
MVAGENTFINSMCKFLGINNCINQNRYPEIKLTVLNNFHPTYVFLSSEPFPFKEKHVKEIQNYFPNSKILLVDGEFFSWYGSRLLQSFKYFSELITALKN